MKKIKLKLERYDKEYNTVFSASIPLTLNAEVSHQIQMQMHNTNMDIIENVKQDMAEKLSHLIYGDVVEELYKIMDEFNRAQTPYEPLDMIQKLAADLKDMCEYE